jgi:hypothetical protein
MKRTDGTVGSKCSDSTVGGTGGGNSADGVDM